MAIEMNLRGTTLDMFRIGRRKAIFEASGLTAERTLMLPDHSGTLALTDAGEQIISRLNWLEDNLALNTLRDIVDAGWSIQGLVEGFADAFSDETGVDHATSTNEQYNSNNDCYIGAAAVSSGYGTTFGNMTQYGGLSAAFDNTSSQNRANSAGSAALSSAYIGKTWDTAKTITGVTVQATDDFGWVSNINPNVTVQLYGKNGLAPANATDGTLISTIGTSLDTNSGSISGDCENATAYDHNWVRITHDGSTNPIHTAEVVFKEAANMTLVSTGQTHGSMPDTARAVLVAEATDAITLNTDLVCEVSRDDGATWTAGALVEEAEYDSASKVYATDDIDISSQPSGTAMRIRIRTLNGANIRIHAWTLQWR